jgi:hypothetical protein
MLLANTILVIHFLFVLFVVGGLPVIWIGAWLRLNFVRNIWLRIAHLAAILFVVGVHHILFYDFPEGMLTIVYILFALLVVATFILIPPYRRNPRI